MITLALPTAVRPSPAVPPALASALPWALWFGFLFLCFYWAETEGPGLANGPSTLKEWVSLLGSTFIWTGGGYLAARLTRRYPLGIRGWRVPMQRHAVALAGFIAAYLGIGVVLDHLFDIPYEESVRSRPGLFILAISALYVLILAVLHAAEYGRRTRRKELEQLDLRRRLVETEVARTRAELSAWRLELNPPTLLRALESIGSALQHDVEGARRILIHVSDFVRGTLDRLTRETVLVEDELASLRSFLDLESDAGRCGTLSIDVPESELDAPVPHMLLQTFVQSVLDVMDDGAAGVTPDVSVAGRHDVLRVVVRGHGPDVESRLRDGCLRRLRSRMRDTGVASAVRLEAGAFILELPLDGAAHRPDGNADSTIGAADPGEPPAGAGARSPGSGTEKDPPRRRRRLALAGWALVFGIMGVRQLDRAIGAPLVGGGAMGWAGAIYNAVISGAVWVAIPGAALHWSRRYPLGIRPATLRHLSRHATVIAGAAVILLGSRLAGYELFGWPEVVEFSFPGSVLAALVAVLAIHFLVAAVAHVFWHVGRYRRREAEEARLQAELAETELRRARAELRTLKLQLNPHFLFNALNALYTLLEADPDGAARLVRRLTDLLQRSMAATGTDVVRLKDEVEFLKPFLDIEELRLDRRVRVIWNMDATALDTPVPHMILQPLVENAIKHGFGAGGGESPRIEISARASAGHLRLEVRDNGCGLHEPTGPSHGIGLSNIRRRLRELYGSGGRVDLITHPAGGAIAHVEVPI